MTSSARITKPRFNLRALASRDFLVVAVPLAIIVGAAGALALRIMRPAPPSVIRFLSGPPGSNFHETAERYKKLVEQHGVKLEILQSRGSLDNLAQLADPKSGVDVGFVQGGVHEGVDLAGLVSLGTMFPLPLLVYEFRDAGEYPKAIEHEIPMSEDAERYYKSGGQFLYKRLPFWLGALMAIDRELLAGAPQTPELQERIRKRLDAIERAVNDLKRGRLRAAA